MLVGVVTPAPLRPLDTIVDTTSVMIVPCMSHCWPAAVSSQQYRLSSRDCYDELVCPLRTVKSQCVHRRTRKALGQHVVAQPHKELELWDVGLVRGMLVRVWLGWREVDLALVFSPEKTFR